MAEIMTTAPPTVLPSPNNVNDTGIRRSLLEDLALKTLFVSGELTIRELGEHMQLCLPVVEELFQSMRREQLCEVKGMVAGIHRMAATQGGKRRAIDLLELNQYVGPAPVSLEAYLKLVRLQTVQGADIHEEDIRKTFSHLVLSDEVLERVGTAVVSGTSIFVYGPTGGGKTSIAETIPNIYPDSVLIPYAVEVDSQIIVTFDATTHRPIEQPSWGEADTRWVNCRRPRVFVGGELTQEMLDLQMNPISKFYSAPLQMKANNGVLIIDDFGRQRIRPEDLLNRWIVPLDRRVDFLTLRGGKKFEVPFDLFVVFATNLNPMELADEAFMRRIQNKIRMGYPSAPQFKEIFRRECERLGLMYADDMAEYFIRVLDSRYHQPLRPCYPRDITHQIAWTSRYEARDALLDRESIDRACRNYFVSPEDAEKEAQQAAKGIRSF
ncbi:MAG TPA: ATP-binding protein [Patescibacteria group bacterium]|nr:ATP-binding protein [Patescibacteria group bacterium]